MEPKNLHFGGGPTETVLHPAVLVAMLVTIVLILILPRKRVMIPFLVFALLTPMGQEIYVGGLHWLVLRIVIVAGCLRLGIEKLKGAELFPNGLNGIDRAFAVWAFAEGLAPILLYRTAAAVPFQMASCLQAFGGYFLLRYTIRDADDIARIVKALAPVALLLGICMAIERFHGINVFGYTHSVPIIPIVRDGTVRAQASFTHPILAGCFGATFLPLLYWLWRRGGAKVLAALGMLGSVLMVFCSASSTPAMALLGGVGALFLWPIRGSMRLVRRGLVVMLVFLQIVMKAPVWFLIARINLTGSSDAYDRAMLVDTFIRHFRDWWLIGADPAKWGFGMWDLSNQFVGVGETGGLLAFVAFILVISWSFGRLGKMRRQLKGDKNKQWLCWSLGAVLFAHIMAYLGVSYFDQTEVWWYACLAMGSAAIAARQSKPAAGASSHFVRSAEYVPALAGGGGQAKQR